MVAVTEWLVYTAQFVPHLCPIALTRSWHEAEGITLFKDVEAETVGDGKAAPANRTDGTARACRATISVPSRGLGIVDGRNPLDECVAYE